MNRTGRSLALGCLLLLSPLLAHAASNSLLVPTDSRCLLDVPPEQLAQSLAACQQVAQSGNRDAQFELGDFYYQDLLTPRELPQALYWFEQASLQGHAQAQYFLGIMFFRGEGVPANNVQAFIVLKMSAVNGSEDALDAADLVAEQMPANEREIANQILGQIFRNYLLKLQELSKSILLPSDQ